VIYKEIVKRDRVREEEGERGTDKPWGERLKGVLAIKPFFSNFLFWVIS
jgi:hypothetical protein